jgi:hypothetical protein
MKKDPASHRRSKGRPDWTRRVTSKNWQSCSRKFTLLRLLNCCKRKYDQDLCSDPQRPALCKAVRSSPLIGLPDHRVCLPAAQHCADFSAREKAISYAILAWNLSLEQPQVREQEQRDIENMIEPDQREQIHSLLEFLIERKETHYRDNRFFIVDYELSETEKGMEIRIDPNISPNPKTRTDTGKVHNMNYSLNWSLSAVRSALRRQRHPSPPLSLGLWLNFAAWRLLKTAVPSCAAP